MSEGAMLPPGAGRLIAGGGLHAVLKVAGSPAADVSTFEIAVPPGYDVGAHVHTHGHELFYVLEGTLDLLAFEPLERSTGDWHDWKSPSGDRYLRGGPGSMLFVPAGVPHAFANLSDTPATMLFQAAPGGHEKYFEELAAVLRAADGPPDPAVIAAIRGRHDIHQLTSLADGRADTPSPSSTS